MTRYENGRAPLSDLVKLGDQHYLPAGTCARWQELQRLAWEKYGVWLVITPGWNGYRPLNIQVQYRAELGIWAAVPGTSSHGLTYQGRDCAAIDVNNWQSLAPGNQSLAWARFVALCRLVGFTIDFVTPQELWHIGDFDPFTIPAFAAINIKPIPVEEEDMNSEQDARLKNVETILAGLQNAIGDPDHGVAKASVEASERAGNAANIASEVRNLILDPKVGILQAIGKLDNGGDRPLADAGDVDLAAIATAVADEQDRRVRERLAK